ncbi:type III glutamate--ammonia ligase [Hydrogenophaga sp.]|uniref:type III glutamate--ammonia ligase n=1 Tax=Hydrogenophaga sp. TaxID=1904254 RepID=UPI0025C2BF23|nr:type III glutamate--ammonia ligase [Hydrogenophaga sp.]MBT9464038.1 type III glutamate--ammonia ligase [Hydrogenophaga sp.]
MSAAQGRSQASSHRSAKHEGSVDSLDERINALRAQGIHSVLTTFTDLPGGPKGKLVPLEGLPGAVSSGAGFSGPSISGTGLPRMGARSEYMGRVVPESLRPLPFMPGVAHAVCDGFAGGEPLDTCSRQVLKRQVERLKARGWTLWVGIEPEFFLLKRDAQGRWQVADAQDQLAKPSYDLQAIGRNHAFLDAMRQTLTALGFGLQQIDHEDACGQYEINYQHDDALAAADRYQLFKFAAQAVAAQHGAVFSTMPKPLAHAPGSGLHFHLSLTDSKGNAVMADPAGALGLSTTGHQFAAGLLHHADALAALCAPTVNSYKRLAASRSASGTTWSPVWKAMGDNNRTCLVRTVAGRIEWRLPDPSCNVYAAIAGTLAAGLSGIEQALPAATPCADDLYEVHARGEALPDRLPRDLFSALQALEQDAPLRAAVGDAFCAEFLTLKHAEWAAYSQQVSDWELERYANAS